MMNKKEYQSIVDNIYVPKDKLMQLQDHIIERNFMKRYYKPIIVVALTTMIIFATFTINPIHYDSNEHQSFVVNVYANNQTKELKDKQTIQFKIDKETLKTYSLGAGSYYWTYHMFCDFPLILQWKGNHIQKIVYHLETEDKESYFYQKVSFDQYKKDAYIDVDKDYISHYFHAKYYSEYTEKEKQLAKKIMNKNEITAEDCFELSLKLRQEYGEELFDNKGLLKYKDELRRSLFWYNDIKGSKLSVDYDQQNIEKYHYYLKILIPCESNEVDNMTFKEEWDIISKHINNTKINVDIQFDNGTSQRKTIEFKCRSYNDDYPYDIIIQ